jgi:hypothetical protein
MSIAGTLYDEVVTSGFGKLLSVNTANNSASLVFGTGLENTSYDSYWFDLDNLFSASNIYVYMLISDAGSSGPWFTTYYHSDQSLFMNDAQVAYYYGSNIVGSHWTTHIILLHQNIIGRPVSGRVRLYQGPETTAYRQIIFQSNSYHSTLNATSMTGGGFATNPTRVKGVAFYPDTGTFSSGTIRMYGVKHL